MASPMQMLISSFLLLLVFLSFSTSTNTSTMKTSSKGQVPCQICISCENPCPPPEPECPPPPPPPPPPEPECPPPPPPEPECPPPPPPTCLECVPCIKCKPGGVPVQPQPRNPQVGVIGGTVYAQPNTASGTVPYFPYYSASTSNIHRKLRYACSVVCLLLATILCFF